MRTRDQFTLFLFLGLTASVFLAEKRRCAFFHIQNPLSRITTAEMPGSMCGTLFDDNPRAPFYQGVILSTHSSICVVQPAMHTKESNTRNLQVTYSLGYSIQNPRNIEQKKEIIYRRNYLLICPFSGKFWSLK